MLPNMLPILPKPVVVGNASKLGPVLMPGMDDMPDGVRPDEMPSNAGKSMLNNSVSVERAWSLLKDTVLPECTMTGNPNCTGTRPAEATPVAAHAIIRAKAANVKIRNLTLSITIPSSNNGISAI
jgi:hypothetical protein